ncbi:MAG: hypothetical protein EXR59_02140 [Dehalococcoidia bacterium]|nr:hypothetical protein [Dehalococcoidia bacterium]
MAPVVRTSIEEILPGHMPEAERIIDSLKEFLSKQNGFILGYRFDLPEAPYSVGKSAIWESEAAANAAAGSDHVMALRSQLAAISKKGSIVEHMHYVRGAPKNLPMPVAI